MCAGVPRCEVKWIDDAGKETPDNNPAVTLAILTSCFPEEKRVRKLLCCAAHQEKLNSLVRRGETVMRDNDGRVLSTSQWSEEKMG